MPATKGVVERHHSTSVSGWCVHQDKELRQTPVTLGPRSIDKVEILQGLKEGDKVVISGTSNFNGAPKVAISN